MAADRLRVALIWIEFSGIASYQGVTVPLQAAPKVPGIGTLDRVLYIPLLHIRRIALVTEAEHDMTQHDIMAVEAWLHERTMAVRRLFWDGHERRRGERRDGFAQTDVDTRTGERRAAEVD